MVNYLRIGYIPTSSFNQIIERLNDTDEIVEVIINSSINKTSFQTALKKVIEDTKMNVEVFTRQQKLYLKKEEEGVRVD